MTHPFHRVLLVHCSADTDNPATRAMNMTAATLRDQGVQVSRYHLRVGAAYDALPTYKKHAVWFWNHRTYTSLNRVMRQTFPDIVHVFAVYPALSPAVYWAAGGYMRPVVQTVCDVASVGGEDRVPVVPTLITRYHRYSGSWRKHVNHWIVESNEPGELPVLRHATDDQVTHASAKELGGDVLAGIYLKAKASFLKDG